MVWLEVFCGLLLSSRVFLFLLRLSSVVGNEWLWLLMCVLINDCWLISECSSCCSWCGLWIRKCLLVVLVVWILCIVVLLLLDMEFMVRGGC